MAVFNLAFAFGLLGNIVSFMVFLAPIPTFYQVYKRKSTEGFQSVPYVVALFSAMLWIYYALLKTNVTLLITINSVGIFIETAYIIFFLIYAPKKPRLQTIKLIVAMNVVGMGLIVVLSMFLTKGTKRVALVGWVCLVFSLCVFVAPLGVVRQVIRTKSVEYMPFLLSFALTLSAVMWFFYGLLIHDFVIAIPNVLGFTFGVIQMILYLVYKNAKKVTNEKIPELSMVIEEQKVPAENMKDQQVIDVVKLSALVCAEILPVVAAKLNENGHNTVEANKNVPMPPKQTVVEVTA